MSSISNNLDLFYTSNSIEFSRSYFTYLKSIFDQLDHSEISTFISKLISAREAGSSIFFIGNGGSASTATHFANDISIGTRSFDKPFKAISLTDNQAVITAVANDYGYEHIFSNQIKVLAKRGDLLIAISASGNSPNLIKAIEYANTKEMLTISLTAFDGGIIKNLASYNVHIPTKDKEYGPAEDIHMIIAGLVGSYLIRYVREESESKD